MIDYFQHYKKANGFYSLMALGDKLEHNMKQTAFL